jgi:hypothetical protein
MVFVARNYCYFPGICCHLRTAQAAKMSLAIDQVGNYVFVIAIGWVDIEGIS